MTGRQILLLAQIYAAHMGISLGSISREALGGHHRFFAQLANGGNVTIRSIDRVAAWLTDRWPQDLPWPADVPCPREATHGRATGGEPAGP
jgi:hypothetical protein